MAFGRSHGIFLFLICLLRNMNEPLADLIFQGHARHYTVKFIAELALKRNFLPKIHQATALFLLVNCIYRSFGDSNKMMTFHE